MALLENLKRVAVKNDVTIS